MELISKINKVPPHHLEDFIYGEKIINKKYTILHKIANEPFSKVYTLRTNKNGDQVIRAIKCESQSVQFPQIGKQAAILNKIFAHNENELGFPRLYEYGSTEDKNYMITKLLGPNIGQLHRLCNNRFSHLTCLLVGLQIIDRLQKIHELGFVYRDIRLENFVIGLGNESSIIYMIDFGHCEIFRNKQTGGHIPYKESNSNIEDSNFISINVHNNVHYTRRDDIESVLYMIIYMLKAKLPWRKVESKSKREKDQKIAEIKKAVSPSYLSSNFGLQMADLFWYIRSVNFYEKPDYDFIRGKLYSMVLSKSEIKTQIEIKYEWNDRQEMDYKIYNGQPKLYLNKNQPQQDEDQGDENEKDPEDEIENLINEQRKREDELLL